MRNAWLVLAIIFLTACQPVAVQQQNTTTTACNPPYYEYTVGDCCLDTEPNNMCDRYENKTVVIPKNLTLGAQQPPKSVISDTIIKFRGNITGYSFVVGKTEYLVRGELARVKLETVKKLDFKVNNTPAFITDIYVDRSARTTTGYCDLRREREILGTVDADRSNCMPLVNMPIALPYDTYNPVLPEDWLTRFAYATPALVETSEQYVKETTGWKLVSPIVHFTENGDEYTLRLESKTGLPIKIDIKEGDLSKVIVYNKLIENKVTPQEVIYYDFHN